MKKRQLIKLLKDDGWYLKRNSGDHEIYAKGKNRIPVPRHNEINEETAKSIIKKLGR